MRAFRFSRGADRPRSQFGVISALAFGLTMVAVGCAPTPTGPKPFDLDSLVLYPLPPDPPRVHFLRSFSGSHDFAQPRAGFAEWLLGQEAIVARTIQKADGVGAFGGRIYVVDQRGRSLFVFDLANEKLEILGTRGPGRLDKPRALHIDMQGHKYVADMGRKQVVVFDAEDAFLTAYGMSDPSQAFTPVAAAPMGDALYVPDIATHRIAVFDRQSQQFVRYIGTQGSAPGQFVFPYAVAPLADNSLLVTDFLNTRVQHLEADGQVRRIIGRLGIRHGQFVRPKGTAVGPDGIIFVVDAAFEVVQMFDASAKVLMAFGGPGNEPGDLVLPTAVATSTDSACIEALRAYAHPDFEIEYLVLVTNQFGEAPVNVYALGAFPAGQNPYEGRSLTPRARPTSQPIDPLQDGDPTLPTRRRSRPTTPDPSTVQPQRNGAAPDGLQGANATSNETTAVAFPVLARSAFVHGRSRDLYSCAAHAAG